ncbi:hypothetical protein BGW80DRAFT_1318981 [Lactifluus volemus]|nr:hypothetical protein BGW80DRAFT_1318981 [Lactifluus volemus]
MSNHYHFPSAECSLGEGSSVPACTPGNRTPRHVQWASEVDEDNRIRGHASEGASDVTSTHELDEAGLDPAAFRTLTHALELHRSSSVPTLPSIPAPSNTSQTSPLYTPSSAESSMPASPKHLGTEINVPGGVFIEPHERAGLPIRRADDNVERGFSDDAEDPVTHTTLPMTRPSGGILAALLALYDQKFPTPSVSDTSTLNFPESRPRVSPTHSLLELASASGKRIANASKALHLPEPRLRRERNAAGVWGPLIACTTGSLVGAAAPTHSTIAPDIKRHGYHLSRYSMENSVPTASTHPPLKRPRGMSFEGNTASNSLASREHFATGIEDLQDLPKHGWISDQGAFLGTPNMATDSARFNEKGYWSTDTENDGRRGATTWRREKKKRRRRKAEIYITRHISSLISRQTFILKLARAMMMFGGPTHRLQSQIQSTARVLEISLSCLYLPDVMLIAFDDDVTSTSNVKLIRQGSSLDLGKVQDAYEIYWQVIHDDTSVIDASAALDALMLSTPLYSPWQLIFFGGMASASICSVSFNGSFIDSLISFPLGGLLVSVQMLSVKNELYSNVFEITIATLLSFLSGALAQTHKFCYSAVASSSVVLILPGFIVLCGSLELSSRNIVAGAVRLCYALVYSLFLGFGLAIGAEVYEKMTGLQIFGPEDYLCGKSHSDAPWYRETPSHFWAFLTVPMFSLFLSLRNQVPWYRKELAVLLAISCVGWVTNHFVGTKFPNQSDISAAVGAFAVGITANIYGRLFGGNAFVVMITGVLFQLPSGLGNGGLLHFASQQASGSSSSTSYLSGFQVALQLISVSVGLTVGLGISLVLVFPIQSRRRKSGVFSL